MRWGGHLLLILILTVSIKSCAEPSADAEEVVEEFLEELQEGEGTKAVRYLHPSYRDSLVEELKLPLQFTEMKPTELLSCALSTMGNGIKETDLLETEMVGDRTALVKVMVEDREEMEKILTFVVMKDAERWYIVDITSFIPTQK